MQRALQWEIFKLTQDATFDYIYINREKENIGQIINETLNRIIQQNKEKLFDILQEVDFNSENILGKKSQKNAILKALVEEFNKLDFRPSKLPNKETIASLYEFVIAIIPNTEKLGEGEFYTPKQICNILSKLVEPKKYDKIYDPACGTGTLLLSLYKEVKEENVSLYGQDINHEVYSMCKLNMFFNQIYDADIKCGDTLANPLHKENNGELKNFDIVISNPPFSLKDWSKGLKPSEFREKFKYGIPPKNIGDYAFISHMLNSLSKEGKMAVVLPHGVLFRQVEKEIRKNIIEQNLIDTIIGLPSNLFYSTSIPVVIIIFRKNKSEKNILFIEASREFEKNRGKNILSNKIIEKIVRVYKNREEIEGYSKIAKLEEIEKNEFNLNIKKYVEVLKKEEEINIQERKERIINIKKEIAKIEKQIDVYIEELS